MIGVVLGPERILGHPERFFEEVMDLTVEWHCGTRYVD